MWGGQPLSSTLRSHQEFNTLPGEQRAPTKPSPLLPSPSAVRQRQSPEDVSTIIYWKREHSRGDRPLLEPWQDKAAPQGARGSRHRSPHSTTPFLLLLQPRETFHPLGKPGGRLKVCRNLHKAIPEVPEQQQGSRDAVRSVCSTCCSKVKLLLLPLVQNSGLAERGLAVSSPSLPCLSFHNDPKACIPHTSQQLAQFITM